MSEDQKVKVGPGSVLGPYEIRDRLGAGGMGEVYRAWDPRLSREVAVKVLRPGLDLDEARVRRFTREASTTGNVNHPNVVVVFDAGVHQGVPYVVSELLEGHPLRWHVTRGTLSPRRAVEWAVQIAEGLAAAHARGVVHRDLKPENVFVSDAGHVKILDFGVAKLLDDSLGSSTTGGSTDVTSPIGTPGYMSPEQLQRGDVDHRADIFAFGAVLYEMLSGRKAFPGSLAQSLTGVLSAEPPPLDGVGAGVQRIVRRCLDKEPGRRFQSAQDLAAALRAESVVETIGASPPWRRMIAAAGLAIAALGLVAGARALAVHRATPPEDVAAGYPAPRLIPLTAFEGRELQPALSADGETAAFVWDGNEGNLDVYARPVAGSATIRLTSDPAPDYCPTFLADGQAVAFVRGKGSQGEIRRISATGGTEQELRPVRLWYGTALSASPDGRWLAFSDAAPGSPFAVSVLSLADGSTRQVTQPDASVFGDAFPTFSPDGGRLAFVRVSARSGLLVGADLVVRDLASGREQVLDHDPWLIGGLDWTGDGQSLVFSSPRLGAPRLFRIPAGGGTAVPLPLNDDPTLSNVTGAEALTDVSLPFRVSLSRQHGRLVYSASRYDTDIWSAGVYEGRLTSDPVRLLASTRLDEAPQFSPDGRRIAFASTRGSRRSEIWVCAFDGTACSQLTSLGVSSGTPRWSPDGRHIVFDAPAGERAGLFIVDVASRLTRQVDVGPGNFGVPSFSRDGASLYFAGDGTAAWQVWTAPVEGGSARPLTRGGGFAAFEDGAGLVYSRSSEPGLFRLSAGRETRVLAGPECWGYWALAPGGIYALDSAQHARPAIVWHPDGGTASPVLALRSAPACGESGISVSPDGRQLIWVEAQRESDIVVVHNFP